MRRSAVHLHLVRYKLFTLWQYELWRTVYRGSANDEYRISPRVPGEYTWPVERAMGYYGRIIAGPLPPLECGSTIPTRNTLVGCFADSKTDRLLNSDTLVVIPRGPGGMTAKVMPILSDRVNGVDTKWGYIMRGSYGGVAWVDTKWGYIMRGS